MAAAHERAAERLERQRNTLRPLGWLVAIAVAIGAISGHPAAGLSGKGLAVSAALVVFVAAIGLTVPARFAECSRGARAATIVVMAGAGVALQALQPHDATELSVAAAVWMAVARVPPLAVGGTLAAGITSALDLAMALAGASSSSVLATTLLCALLALMAVFMGQARANEDRAEVLLAELEDAREEQLRAAAFAERGRIAGELHDVLAHSLSGAAIQLQGARMLGAREQVPAEMQAAIERASELVKGGLADARQAVGALRGERVPTVAQLPSLIEAFRQDMNLDASLSIVGAARELSTEASLALYRGAQEALTNVARYAPGARTAVVLAYGSDRTTLSIEDARAGGPRNGLRGVGGGRGLAGMRERVEQAGGTMRAGPSGEGWRVELDVPA
ncbi:MAG TPA: histidine kinase [Solirubrobacteraceae bacterium]|nr:histidine kinase [Solirubrobacteraceae bacterium]